MSPSDHDLLRDYALAGSQAAFATLVERHLNLVYSAARRQVRSPQHAEDVAQLVFVDLARNANRFKPDTPLVAWLHVVTRRAAIDFIRRESRRQAREQQAVELTREEPAESAMKPSSSNWSAVEPLLDEAVESLNETDRAAILLRYFENKSLRDIGAALGASEDAAQKRVSRAVEQLRTFFLRRGVAVTATGLATDLSAHAIASAPIALGSTITAAASIGVVHSTTISAGYLTMTLLEKSIFTAGLAFTVGAALFEANSLRAQRSELSALHLQTDALAAQVRDIQSQRDLALRRVADARQRLAARPDITPATPADAALEAAMKIWLDRLAHLRQMATDHPELTVPEIKLLTDEDWYQTTRSMPAEIESDPRKALITLRATAEQKFAAKLRSALRAYVDANGGILPIDTHQLAPFFDQPLAPGTLDRYTMAAQGRLSDLSGPQRNALIEERSPLDWEQDFIWRIGATGEQPTLAVEFAANEAIAAFTSANHGALPTNAAQLQLYLRAPIDPARLTYYLERRPTKVPATAP